MSLSLYQRLAITTSVIFIVMVYLLFGWMQVLEETSRLQAEQEMHQDLAKHLVADSPLLNEGDTDKKALENLFHTMMILGPSFEFYVLDELGNIKIYSADPALIVRDKVDLVPIKDMLGGEVNYPYFGDDPRNIEGKKVFSVAPLINNESHQGYLYVIIGGQIYDSIFERVLANKKLQITFIIVSATLLFLLASLLVTFRIFVKPLRNLTKEVDVIRNTSFEEKLTKLNSWKSSHGEVHELGSTFNKMIEKINHQMELLQEADSHRRELLSHISHDLRTPLASLQGYIETIDIKYESLTPEQHSAFLKRALKNATQLKRLIDQIFELAHLESGQVALQIEQFLLTELLYDLRDKFAISAANKNITINIESPSDPLKIKTDIGKLERILSNLIENALRHTASGGYITLGVTVINNQAGWVVSVEDNGEGIAADEIPLIFDSNFRARNAKENQTEHIGLGLAITRELLNLLGSEIKVSSHLGKGTRFSFVLC